MWCGCRDWIPPRQRYNTFWSEICREPIQFLLNYVYKVIFKDNVLIALDGRALICDFGSTQMETASGSLAGLTSTIKGTSIYLTPELIDFQTESVGHSKETDIWACGMLLYVRVLWTSYEQILIFMFRDRSSALNRGHFMVVMKFRSRFQYCDTNFLPLKILSLWTIISGCLNAYSLYGSVAGTKILHSVRKPAL